jgi:hypothetical protein
MSFADLELLRQGVRLEPSLHVICDFLDRQPALIERVRRDLVRGLKEPRKGRCGLTAPQVLRALVLMRLKNWDYRELRERIADVPGSRRVVHPVVNVCIVAPCWRSGMRLRTKAKAARMTSFFIGKSLRMHASSWERQPVGRFKGARRLADGDLGAVGVGQCPNRPAASRLRGTPTRCPAGTSSGARTGKWWPRRSSDLPHLFQNRVSEARQRSLTVDPKLSPDVHLLHDD